MNFNWPDVVATLTGNAVLVGAVGWYLKSAIAHRDAKQLERFRQFLRQTGVEHEVRFKLLHEKRAEMVEAMHGDLVDAFRAVNKVITPFQGEEFETARMENARAALSATQSFVTSFEKKKIYLSEDLANEIEAFVQELWRETYKFHNLMNMAEMRQLPKNYESRDDAWQKSWDAFSKKCPPILQKLQREFRILLGVEMIQNGKEPAGD